MAFPSYTGPFPPNFQFSQASLQDYVDCPRRFQLRYLLRLAWPAPPAEPLDAFEQHIRNGELFHRLVHQHVLGLPAESLTRMIGREEEDLGRWWQNYLGCAPDAFPGATRYPEVSLSTTIAGHRLIAKYDLVAVEPSGAGTIVDWKTGDKRPKRGTLAARLQTRVYRYVLVRSGACLSGGQSLRPDQVRMIYWFAGHPKEPEVLVYDAVSHKTDGQYLENLICEITRRYGDEYAAPDEGQACRFCCYRSLCDRGTEAGQLEAMGDEPTEELQPELSLDFEQIGEIAF